MYYREMANPEGPTAHVVRGYATKMIDIYHRYLGIEELRTATDEETAARLDNAVDTVVEMGKAVEPSDAALLAAQIPTQLEPTEGARKRLLTVLGWVGKEGAGGSSAWQLPRA